MGTDWLALFGTHLAGRVARLDSCSPIGTAGSSGDPAIFRRVESHDDDDVFVVVAHQQFER